LTDKRGNTILYCLPAQIDLSKYSTDVCIHALAFYLQAKMLDRHSLAQFTLILDVRAGRCWANPPAFQLLSLIRQASHTLQDLFPQRKSQCLVTNVPRAAVVVYDKLVRPLLFRHATSSSQHGFALHLLAGGALVDSSMACQLCEHLESGYKGVQVLEQIRKEAFR
jgi:hypothetical protein